MATRRPRPQRRPTAPARNAAGSSFFADLLADLVDADAIAQDKAQRLEGLDEHVIEAAVTTRELMKLAIAVRAVALVERRDPPGLMADRSALRWHALTRQHLRDLLAVWHAR